MTATTIENALRARRHRRAGGSVVAGLVFCLCAGGGVAAPAAAETDADEQPTVEVHLTAGSRGTVAPGSATTASVTVENDSTSRLSSGTVTVELNRTPLTDDASIAAWLDEADASGSFEEVGTDTTAPVDPDGAVTSSLAIPAESLDDLAPGVYPLRARVSGASSDDPAAPSGALTSTTVLVVTETPAMPVTVFVPVTATPDDGALLTADELTALTAPDGALTALLDGVTGTSAVLAIDPSIPAAIRALGSAAPEPVREWLARLDALPNERFALQFGDADPATQAQAALPALLQPTTLTPFLNPSDFVQATEPTPEPTDEPTPAPEPTDGPVLPDLATLTTVEGATPDVLWPRSDLSSSDLDTLSAYVPDGAAVTVLSSSSVEGEIGGRALSAAHDVLVVDDAVSTAASKAASTDDAAVRQRWLAEANAHLFFTARSSGAAPVLVGLDRDDRRSAEALREAVTSFDTVGFGLSGLLAASATPVTLTAELDTSRAVSLNAMLDSEVTLGDFATMLDDPQLLLGPKRIQIMRATAVGLSANGFVDAVAAVGEATRTTLRAVDIPPASTIQLLSANADLPFSVRNELPWPVNVRLSVFPSDARLDVESVTEATIQPGTTSRVRVPVAARVGSGEVSLRLELSSPTGVPIGTPETVRVSVRAEWETIGLAAFGGLIVLLLGLGIIRTVRRKRREHGDETADDSAVEMKETNE